MPRLTRTVVSVHSPLIFNGRELADYEHTRQTRSIARLWEDFIKDGRIDVAPPYQRDEAWTVEKEQQFISSCLNRTMAIPPLYLCKKTNRQNCVHFWALDCRQRVTAIKNFMENKFHVLLKITYDDNTTKKVKVYWREIVAEENYLPLKDIFLNRELDVVTFDYMPLEDQRKVFLALNNGAPLNGDETNYCNFFLARRLMSHVFDEVFMNLKTNFPDKVKYRRRFGHIKTAHELVMLCMGNGMGNEPDARGLNKKQREDSAKKIHEKLEGTGFGYYDILTPELLATLGMTTALPLWTRLAEFFNDIFAENTTLGRENEDGIVKRSWVATCNAVEPIAFVYKLVKQGRYDINRLDDDKASFVKLLKSYFKDKAAHGLNQSTSEPKVMAAKYKELERLAKKHLDIAPEAD